MHERVYTQSRLKLLSVISDIMELQKGKETMGDTKSGIICFATTMYGNRQENRFTVLETDGGCMVRIDISGGDESKSREAMFALLESMMLRFGEIGEAKNNSDRRSD